MHRMVWSGLLMLSAGCMRAGDVRGYPLYGGERQPRAEVALLVGDIAEVDGENVSAHGHRFELLPGCHVVTNLKNWGGSDHNGFAKAHLPEVPFAMDMKAGLTYQLRIATKGPLREGFRVNLKAEEQDKTGKVLREFSPSRHC